MFSEKTNIKNLIICYISLVCAVLFFSGALKDFVGGIFDFAKVSGTFPSWLAHGNGVGAKGGFIFAFTLVPSIMLALAMISVFEYYGALNAASQIFTFLLRPLMGIKGVSAISLIASLQSADAGSSTARLLHDEKKLTDKELLIFASFQFSGAAMLTNFLSSLAPLLSLNDGTNNVPSSIAFCLGVILFFKFFGANVMRLYVKLFVK